MLSPRRIAIVVSVALLAAGCAPAMTVGSFVEPGLNPAPYRTFDWGSPDELPTGDPRLDENPYFQDHMQGAVEKQMAARGFARGASGASDILVHYHATISQRLDVDRLDREYGYCTGNDCQVGTTAYEAGTLVMDVVDTKTKRVIWRGWARLRIEDVLNDADEMAERVNEAVTRMLQQFPAAL